MFSGNHVFDTSNLLSHIVNDRHGSIPVWETGDLRFSGSIIRKSRCIFTKERRTIRQKELLFKSMKGADFPGKHPDAGADQAFLERGFICIKDVGFGLWI